MTTFTITPPGYFQFASNPQAHVRPAIATTGNSIFMNGSSGSTITIAPPSCANGHYQHTWRPRTVFLGSMYDSMQGQPCDCGQYLYNTEPCKGGCGHTIARAQPNPRNPKTSSE